MASDRFVSRGGEKLQAGIDNFQIDVTGRVVLDVGSSTGGFVDCLLQNGAAKVYSVDTAYGELAWKLRKDERVIVMERTNILHLTSLRANAKQSRQGNPSDLDRHVADAPRDDDFVDLISIDASWTKLELILPVVKKFLKKDGEVIALLKPHYQADKKNLVRGVLPADQALSIKGQVVEKISELGFKVEKEMESPILGGGGNIEYLLHLNLSSV